MNENTTVKVVKGFFYNYRGNFKLTAWSALYPCHISRCVQYYRLYYRNHGKPEQDGWKISSYRSMKGITKKVTMWLLIVVGAIIDQLILYASDTLGFEFPFKFLIACVVAVWIICNELISILENVIDIGVEIPPFWCLLWKTFKSQAEKSVQVEEWKKVED